LILHEDAFGYGFIGRTGLYFSPKRQACGLLALSLALSHGERGLGCRAPSDFQKPDSLSPWERVRERATNRKVCQILKCPYHSYY